MSGDKAPCLEKTKHSRAAQILHSNCQGQQWSSDDSDSFSSHRSWIPDSLWADHERLCIPKYPRLKLKLRLGLGGSGAWSKSTPQLCWKAVSELQISTKWRNIKKRPATDVPTAESWGIMLHHSVVCILCKCTHSFIYVCECVYIYFFTTVQRIVHCPNFN